MASDIRGWLPALGMRPLELVRAAAVIWGAHIAATAHGSVGKFMFSFIFLSLARILKTLWGVLTTKNFKGIHVKLVHVERKSCELSSSANLEVVGSILAMKSAIFFLAHLAPILAICSN